MVGSFFVMNFIAFATLQTISARYILVRLGPQIHNTTSLITEIADDHPMSKEELSKGQQFLCKRRKGINIRKIQATF